LIEYSATISSAAWCTSCKTPQTSPRALHPPIHAGRWPCVRSSSFC
jgi:hypothetical protein